MPELLVFAKDWSAEITDPEQLASLPKVGDVIAWQPNGSEWSQQELKNPLFRIIWWTATAGGDGDILNQLIKVSPATFDTVQGRIKAFRFRDRGFDLSRFSQAVRDQLADSSRTNEKIQVTRLGVINALITRAEVSVPIGTRLFDYLNKETVVT